MKNTNFLPQGYEQPQSSGGNHYLKLQKGETRFRVISKPIVGTLAWSNDNKPHRFRMGEPVDGDWKEKPKHFWAMVVFNYELNQPQILEISQATIIESMVSLINDDEWGAPFSYDLKIKRTGEKMETSYNVSPSPKKALTPELKKAFEGWEIKLENLFSGDDPFISVPQKAEQPDVEPMVDEKPGEETDLPF